MASRIVDSTQILVVQPVTIRYLMPERFSVASRSVSKKPLKRCLYTTTSSRAGVNSSMMSVFHVSLIKRRLVCPFGA